MKFRLMLLVVFVCLLTGCASLLEREYSTSEPHSSKFWESEAAGTLRAENYQDVVNDLLLLIGQHRETATLFLYNFTDDLTVADTLERAAVEIQQETPLGAYAVEFITSSAQAQHGYYEVKLQIGYRRTPEQLQAMVNATSPEALYSLLDVVLDAGGNELAVRIGYWGADGRSRVESAIQQIREDRGLTNEPRWSVNYYPANSDSVGLVEVLLDVPPEEGAEEHSPELPEEGTESGSLESENGESGVNGEDIASDEIALEPELEEKDEKEKNNA